MMLLKLSPGYAFDVIKQSRVKGDDGMSIVLYVCVNYINLSSPGSYSIESTYSNTGNIIGHADEP